jgi:Pectate lyase superfamily protein
MTIPFSSTTSKPEKPSTSRRFANRPTDIVNVKDYGAYGDGSHDDAGAIQATFDTAFGSSTSPHGLNTKANRPVFFPAGHYLVGTPLTLTSVSNGCIIGAGSRTTVLTYTGRVVGGRTITSLIGVNGMYASTIEGLTLDISGPQTVCLNLDYISGPINVYGDVMIDVVTKNATSGCLMGLSGSMGSEMVFIDCEFNDHSHAGIKTCNGNALVGQVYNSVFKRCSIAPSPATSWHSGGAAVYASTGSIQAIVGCTFIDSGNVDIYTSGGEGAVIIGCHSTNSLTSNGSHGPSFAILNTSTYLRGCSFSGAAKDQYIMWFTGKVIVDGCNFPNGRFVDWGSSHLYVRGCAFGNPNALTGYKGTLSEHI